MADLSKVLLRFACDRCGARASVTFELFGLNAKIRNMKIVENSKYSYEKGNTLSDVNTNLPTDSQFSFSVLWRGIKKRCPKCGIGSVLTGYLKPASSCSHCGEDFSHISADDGPAWLTLLIVGHAIVPLMLVFGRDNATPAWFSITGQDMFTNDQESQDHTTDR